MYGASVSRRMRSGLPASDEAAAFARRRRISDVFRFVVYVTTPASVMRLDKQQACYHTCNADVQVGKVLEQTLRELRRVGEAVDVKLQS